MSESNLSDRIRIEDLPAAEQLTPEEKELLAGAGPKTFRPSIESLEERVVMDATGGVAGLRELGQQMANVRTFNQNAGLQSSGRVQQDTNAASQGSVRELAPGIKLEGTTLKITGSDYTSFSYSASVRLNDAGQLAVTRGFQGVSTPDASVTLDPGLVKRIEFEGGEGTERFKNFSGIPSTFTNQVGDDTHETRTAAGTVKNLADGIKLEGTTLKIRGSDLNYQDFAADVRQYGANGLEVTRGPKLGKKVSVTLDRGLVTNIVFVGKDGNERFANYSGISSTFEGQNQQEGDRHVRFQVSSPEIINGRLDDSAADPGARRNGKSIGENKAPTLTLEGAPAETLSLAVVTKDISVPKTVSPTGEYIHQILYNIPKGTQNLDSTALPVGTVEAIPYAGAHPPDGKPHEYVTTVYVLRTANLEVPPDATPEQIEKAIKAQSIGQTSVSGKLSADVREGWNTRTNTWNPGFPK